MSIYNTIAPLTTTTRDVLRLSYYYVIHVPVLPQTIGIPFVKWRPLYPVRSSYSLFGLIHCDNECARIGQAKKLL